LEKESKVEKGRRVTKPLAHAAPANSNSDSDSNNNSRRSEDISTFVTYPHADCAF
jgi:hypothetical protein